MSKLESDDGAEPGQLPHPSQVQDPSRKKGYLKWESEVHPRDRTRNKTGDEATDNSGPGFIQED